MAMLWKRGKLTPPALMSRARLRQSSVRAYRQVGIGEDRESRGGDEDATDLGYVLRQAVCCPA